MVSSLLLVVFLAFPSSSSAAERMMGQQAAQPVDLTAEVGFKLAAAETAFADFAKCKSDKNCRKDDPKLDSARLALIEKLADAEMAFLLSEHSLDKAVRAGYDQKRKALFKKALRSIKSR